MKTGFYCVGNRIYYGDYPEEQVSGRVRLSAVKPELIGTDVPFSEDDFAVRFWDNHALTEVELADMDSGIAKIMRCAGVSEFSEVDFSETEKRLGTELPSAIKVLYKYLISELMAGSKSRKRALLPQRSGGNDARLVGIAKGNVDGASFCLLDNERFLMPDELYIDGGNLVFYKIKRTPVAISLSDGVLRSFHKKAWEYDKGDEGFMCFAMNRIVVKSILRMPFTKSGRIEGELKTTLSPKKELERVFGGAFKVLEEYRNYGNVILYSEDGALGWFRQNGLYADILLGCADERTLNNLQLIIDN